MAEPTFEAQSPEALNASVHVYTWPYIIHMDCRLKNIDLYLRKPAILWTGQEEK